MITDNIINSTNMTEPNEKLYIIVLNWNGTNDTIECIKSIKINSLDNYTIVLVDNGSQEISLLKLMNWCQANFTIVALYSKTQAEQGGILDIEEKLEREKSNERLVFIQNNENLGFAAGNNVALRYMLKSKATYAMLLNNDTVIEKDSLTNLMDFFNKNHDYVAATPQIRYFEPNDTIWNCGGKVTWLGNRRYYYAGDKISKIPKTGFKRITFITGCALIFKPHNTGLLSEKFFFGEEDFEFSLRLKKQNQRMTCVFDSVIYHKVGGSINSISKLERKIVLHYAMRLMDLKEYQNCCHWHLTFLFYLIYSFGIITISYKISIKYYFLIWKKIIFYAKKHDSINKKLFEEIMFGV